MVQIYIQTHVRNVFAYVGQRSIRVSQRVLTSTLLALLLALFSGQTAHAQLVVTTDVPSVSRTPSAGVVIEASSTHTAVIFVYPDFAAQRTATQSLLLAPGRSPAFLGLPHAQIDDFAEGRGGIAAVFNSVRRRNWGITNETFGGRLNADLRVTFHADPVSVAAAAKAFQEEYVKQGQSSVQALSIEQYNAKGVSILRELAETLELKIVVNSAGAKRALPAANEYATPLGWLYRFALDHEGDRSLSACGFRDAYRVRAATERSTPGSPAQLYHEFISRAENFNLGLINLYRTLDFVKEVGVVRDLYGEQISVGAVDPVVVEITRCKALKLLRGEEQSTRLIVERSQIYREASRLLSERTPGGLPGGASKFFSAAAAVTRAVGLGGAEAADQLKIKGDEWYVKRAEEFFVDTQCRTYNVGEGLSLPDEPERELLRTVNQELFRQVNLPRMRRLYANPGAFFDPIDFGRLSVPEGLTQALAFDLRMVEAEQIFVEAQIKGKIVPGGKADDDLTRSQQAISCVSHDRLTFSIFGLSSVPDHFQQLKTIGEMLRELEQQGLIQQGGARFSNYWWRVAIGTAYVFSLHFDEASSGSWKDRYIAYFRRLIEESRRSASAAGLPPTLDDQLREIVNTTPSFASQELQTSLREALYAYLSNEIGKRDFYTCNDNPPLQALEVTPGPRHSSSLRARIQHLGDEGPNVLAETFELLADDGALVGADPRNANGKRRPGIHLSAMPPQRQSLVCDAISERRRHIDCVLGETDILRCTLPEFLADDDKRILIFENSRELRSALGVLGPFLLIELENAGAISLFTRSHIDAIVNRLVLDATRYIQDVSIVAVLARHDRVTLDKLGLKDVSKTDLRNVLDRAIPKGAMEGSLKDNPAAVQQYAANFSVKARANRIRSVREDLARVVKPVRDRYRDRNVASIPEFTGALGGDLSSIAALQGEAAEAGTTLAENILGLNTQGSGIGFELDERDSADDGTRLYDASLVYRRPKAVNAATATVSCVEAGDQRNTAACSDIAGEGSTKAETLERIPLGLNIISLRMLSGGALEAAAGIGEADIFFDKEEAVRGLYTLGMPRMLTSRGIDLEWSKDLKDISLLLNLNVGPVELRQTRLPLIEDGKVANPEAAVRATIMTLLDTELAEAVARSAALADQLSISIPGPPRISFAAVPDQARAIIDWEGESATVTVPFRLSIGMSSVGATAELTVSSDGIGVRGLAFENDVADVLSRAILEVEAVKVVAERVNGHLLLLPEFDGRSLNFVIRMMPPGCLPTVELRVSIAELDSIGAKLDASLENAADAALDCATQKLLEELNGGQVNLFGLLFEVQTDGEAPATQNSVALAYAEGQFGSCREPPASLQIGKVRIQVDGASFRFDLSSLDEAQRKALGRGVACKVRQVMPLGPDFLEVSDVEIGASVIAADLKLKGLPWIGDFVLPRVNFADVDKNIGDVVVDQLGVVIESELSDELSRRLSGGLDVPGVGRFELSSGGVKVTLFSGSREISLSGTVQISDFTVPATLKVPLDGSISDLKVEISAEDIKNHVEGEVLGLLTDMLPFAGTGIEIRNLKFVQIDSLGNRWGFVFGVKVGIPLGDFPIDLEIRRVAITYDRVELDQEIRLGLAVPMYFGPVALSRILLIYHTGSGGGKAGISLGADLTAVEPQLANVLKLESVLDLRDIDRLRFTLEGNLIALNTITLFEAFGEVELNDQNQLVAFNAKTSAALEKILRVKAEGRIDGGRKLFLSRSEVGLLGINLLSNNVEFCSKDCPYPSGGGPGRFDVSMEKYMLFGYGNIGGGTDLGFRQPQFGGGIRLDLFGWSPGGADFDVTLRRSRVQLKFLGIGLKVTTPSVETMTPGLILDVLLSLFDISLEDLLKLDPKDIQISLLSGDGEVSDATSDGGGESDGGSDASSDAESNEGDNGEGKREAKTPPGPQSGLPSAPNQPTGGDAQEENGTSFAQKHWGTARGTYYCEKIFGSNGWNVGADDDRFDLWFRTELQPSKSPLFSGHPHKTGGAFHSLTYWGKSTRQLCHSDNGSRLILLPNMVPVAAKRSASLSNYTCDKDGFAEIEIFTVPGDENDERVNSQYNAAVRPVACVKEDDGIVDFRARLFVDKNPPNHHHALLLCPRYSALPKEAKADVFFENSCKGPVGLIDLGPLPGNRKGAEIISGVEEISLIQDKLRPLIESGRAGELPQPDEFEIQFENWTFSVSAFPETGIDGELRARRFIVAFPSTVEGRNQLITFRVWKRSKLWSWIERKNFRDAILARWIVEGRRPIVEAAWPDDNLLVLKQRQKTNHEKQIWLWERPDLGKYNLPALAERRLDFPRKAPNYNSGFDPITGPVKTALLDAVRARIKILGEAPDWRLVLGRAREAKQLLITFEELPSAGADRELKILIDRDPGPNVDAASVWTGRNLAVLAPERRFFCTTTNDLRTRLEERLLGSGSVSDQDLRLALTDPLAYRKQLNPLEHPLASMTRGGLCQ